MVPGVLLEPYMSQGDQSVTETPIVSKGLIQRNIEQLNTNYKEYQDEQLTGGFTYLHLVLFLFYLPLASEG